jgi:2-haloacid dehalogenase
MVQAVVWDIGNIFAVWDPESYYDRLIGRARRERFFSEARAHEMNAALDLGADVRATVAAHAETHPLWADEIRRWFEDWPETFREAVPGTEAVFAEAQASGLPMVALSNFGAETLEMARDLHPVLRRFDREFVSAHLGVAKPDPAIYAAVEEGLGLRGEALIFTDDKAENVEAAAARGWKVHLFEGAGGWRKRLVAEGVIPA